MYAKPDLSFAANITTGPSSVSTCPNREVMFFCAAENANLFLWYLNGSPAMYMGVTSDADTNLTDIPPSSVLKMTIPKEFGSLNQTMIRCDAVDTLGSNSPHAMSSIALLLIQGTREY